MPDLKNFHQVSRRAEIGQKYDAQMSSTPLIDGFCCIIRGKKSRIMRLGVRKPPARFFNIIDSCKMTSLITIQSQYFPPSRVDSRYIS